MYLESTTTTTILHVVRQPAHQYRSTGEPRLRARLGGSEDAATSYTYIHSSYSSFARRYEHARRALRAGRRTALLGFPLPAAQRIDARYEKTYRASQRNHPG